jgi:hypothetical protein
MEFLYRNATPAYKGIHPQQASPSFPSGIVSSLFAGGGTPSYKIASSNGASAPTPARSWWQTLIPTPVYKTAPAVACVDESEMSPDNGDAADNTDGCVDASDQVPQVVIL